jgi:pyruvate kinase
MLDSMMENPRPTRAEVTDVYYAAISGTDATMLSGESASGDFPKEAVETMATINLEAEKNFNYLEAFEKAFATTETKNAHSAFQVAKKALTEDVKYVIAFSEKGRLIKALSTFRLNTPVLALIKEEKLVTKFGANYGIYAQAHSNLEDYSDDAKVSAIAKEMGVPAGTKVIVANKNDHRKLVIA